MDNLNSFDFTNTEYKAEWAQIVPGTEHRYCDGTYASVSDSAYSVYDGAANFMGKISADGTITCNGEASEYKMSFLRSAKAAIGK